MEDRKSNSFPLKFVGLRREGSTVESPSERASERVTEGVGTEYWPQPSRRRRRRSQRARPPLRSVSACPAFWLINDEGVRDYVTHNVVRLCTIRSVSCDIGYFETTGLPDNPDNMTITLYDSYFCKMDLLTMKITG